MACSKMTCNCAVAKAWWLLSCAMARIVGGFTGQFRAIWWWCRETRRGRGGWSSWSEDKVVVQTNTPRSCLATQATWGNQTRSSWELPRFVGSLLSGCQWIYIEFVIVHLNLVTASKPKCICDLEKYLNIVICARMSADLQAPKTMATHKHHGRLQHQAPWRTQVRPGANARLGLCPVQACQLRNISLDSSSFNCSHLQTENPWGLSSGLA